MTSYERNKVLQILMYATLLNSDETKQSKTGDKPTVFVDFSGHTNQLDVQIYYDGWKANDEPDVSYCIYFSEDMYERSSCEIKLLHSSYVHTYKLLDKVLTRVKTLYQEWRDKPCPCMSCRE